MIRFWLATFERDAPLEEAVGPIVAGSTGKLAIEVLQEGEDWSVLFSSANDSEHPKTLTSFIGFATAAKACSVWLDRGFRLVDATITEAAGALRVFSPFFGFDQTAMFYDRPLLTLSGVNLESAAPARDPSPLSVDYEQKLSAPDGAQPDLFVATRPVKWSPRRSNVRQWPPEYLAQIQIDLGDSPARWPSLAWLASGPLQPRAAWSGEIQLPERGEAKLGPPNPRKIAHAFGVPAFRFEDVEVLGFRLDLAALGHDVHDVHEKLAELVKPLNFHLNEPEHATAGGAGYLTLPDFRYRAATSILLIELLRYGRMKARVPVPPLGIDDSQSQHELLVRLLVGRVDEDCAQARDPAVYAPAIFVDNPWSKVVGRDAIGYDKRMAEFCVLSGGREEPLFPDGRLAAAAGGTAAAQAEPLGDIRRVRLVERTGAGRGAPLLDLDFSTDHHKDPDALLPIDLDLIFGTSVLAGTRWRQSDFNEVAFRRSFASLAIADSLRSFRSIQVAPVVDRNLELTWITSTFTVEDDLRAAMPIGTATLTLHEVPRDDARRAAPSAPAAWNLLCKMLGDGRQATTTFGFGSWYRLIFSMDLTIDDGLDW
jgi:hypothetical protein